jgi:hypothetical protein
MARDPYSRSVVMPESLAAKTEDFAELIEQNGVAREQLKRIISERLLREATEKIGLLEQQVQELQNGKAH